MLVFTCCVDLFMSLPAAKRTQADVMSCKKTGSPQSEHSGLQQALVLACAAVCLLANVYGYLQKSGSSYVWKHLQFECHGLS
jgi:hypothetical protein